MERTVMIIVLSLQVSFLSFCITKMSYNLGYAEGRIHVLTTFQPEESK
jgi:hypothetical protein